MFRYADRSERAGPGATVFVPAGMPHTYSAGTTARYLIILTPRIAALISALQADRDPAHQHDIYRRFDSELLEPASETRKIRKAKGPTVDKFP